MRPLKELIKEEYWNVAYRVIENGESVFDGNSKEFSVLPESKRYWYADPFLFEYRGSVYLFVEMFDNVTQKGVIGFSKLENGAFTKPQVVLEEAFHLSYPFVFEENGEIYMMPETMGDNCIQLYKAVDFPTKWKKETVLLNIENAVDTVLLDDWLITCVVTDSAEKKTRLELYNRQTGEAHKRNPVCGESQIIRGAGRIFDYNANKYRPAQNCENGIYGAGLVFYRIQKCDSEAYEETEVFRFYPKDIKLKNEGTPCGVHTYARGTDTEVIDFKNYRFNFKRLLWIVRAKIQHF